MMRSIKLTLIAILLWALCFTTAGLGQGLYQQNGANGRIDAGTAIAVRTNENINANNSDGRVYSGVVDQDVMNRNGYVAIPRGSSVELLVKRISNNELALDLDSVMINGERYGLQTDENIVSSQSNGLGANKRTGEYVGGGSILGAIIGAIAGGGKGAAIGAGAGAAAGAGAQVLTRGNRVSVPAESLLTFQLSQPLQAGVSDRGYTQNGVHYHSDYATPNQSAAYQEGWQVGRSHADRNLPQKMPAQRWSNAQDRRDYQSGYNDGYQNHGAYNNNQGAYNNGRQTPGYNNNYNNNNYNGRGSLTIGNDHNINWQGPNNARVYVQMDNEPLKLFASGASGVQPAPWIQQGHVYTFILKDANGNEIARDQQDLRYSNRGRQSYR
jgi:hypothetical protein